VNILVTAGNTQTPIDRVRCITNIFTGRTGSRIALHAYERGHTVTLLTSHPDVVKTLRKKVRFPAERWSVTPYRTFDDLHDRMELRIRQGMVDAVIHSAAVSDYHAAGIYAPDPATRFRLSDRTWESAWAAVPRLIPMDAGKVKSDAPELWLRLVRAPKLVDLVRSSWGFQGILVKFKLEVGVSQEQLLKIAEGSRRDSDANLMVANTLAGAKSWAYLGPVAGLYRRVSRRELPGLLLEAIERLHLEKRHG
jgi:phosphopantothenoylcysteine synthetase/decarboxylase